MTSNKTKQLLKILNKGKFFLLLAFFNSFSPIFLSLISSFVSKYGAQAVMGIGYVSVFQLGFAQLGVAVACGTIFILIRNKNKFSKNKLDNNNIFFHSLIISIFIGILITAVYIICSYFYMDASTNRPNTQLTLTYGMNYTYSSSLYIFLICFKSLLILYIFYKKEKRAFQFEIASNILCFLLSAILGIATKLDAIGVGLGQSIGIFVTTILLIIYIYYHHPIKFNNFRIFKDFKILLKNLIQEATPGISVSLYKGIALLMLGLIIPYKLNTYVPLSYQMARVLWFNIMYAIPWLGFGISDAIRYWAVYSDKPIKGNNLKKYWIFALGSMIFALGLSVGGVFLIKPLSSIYIRNKAYSGLLPEFIFGETTGSVKDLITNIQKNPPPIEYPTIPDYVLNSKPEDLFKNINKWILTDKTIEMENLKIWLKKTGITHFMATAPIDEKISFIKVIVLGMVDWVPKYLQYCTYDKNLIYALLVYRTPYQLAHPETVMVAKFGYNSFSYIYIAIYGVLCAGWSVLLPSSVKITGRQVKPFIVSFVYAASVAGIIIFGTWFSLFETNPQQPFKYMDAWTFPLAVVASVVSIYLWTKWSIITIKYRDRESYNHRFKLKPQPIMW